MSTYEIGILGLPTSDERRILAETIGEMVHEFGLVVGTDVVLLDNTGILSRQRRSAFAAAYFGCASPHPDKDQVASIVKDSAPIIPTIAGDGSFITQIPDILHPSNGLRRRHDDLKLAELASALLECVGLLRRQRRIFISYRRVEARSAALQMHDELSGRGFTVFLDTHDIRYGKIFQTELWHNLCDSDLMLMFDTPTYFESKWTVQEIGRARAKGIHVLRAVWPDHNPARAFSLSETVFLGKGDLLGADGPLEQATVDRLALMIESMRSRSIASRYLAITGRLRSEIEVIGAQILGIGSHRAILVELPTGQKVWTYPVVGIPSAQTLYDIASKAKRADQLGKPILVYDEAGLGDEWKEHLRWLAENIQTVKSIKVHEAGWALTGGED